MSVTHNDLRLLIEFSIENNLESAIRSFPMFSLQQIQGLYDISISQRIQLLQEWGVEDSATAHFLRHFHDPHNPGPGRKDQTADDGPLEQVIDLSGTRHGLRYGTKARICDTLARRYSVLSTQYSALCRRTLAPAASASPFRL